MKTTFSRCLRSVRTLAVSVVIALGVAPIHESGAALAYRTGVAQGYASGGYLMPGNFQAATYAFRSGLGYGWYFRLGPRLARGTVMTIR